MLRVLQINLLQLSSATTEHLRNLDKGKFDVALVQEPWVPNFNTNDLKVVTCEGNDGRISIDPRGPTSQNDVDAI